MSWAPEEGDTDLCQDRAGFLFKHRCPRIGSTVCEECTKRLCNEHASLFEGRDLCVACRRKASHGDETKGEEAKGRARTDDSSDVYFYATSHYHGWGYYRDDAFGYEGRGSMDLTEADGASLREEGAGDFEHDYVAS